MDHDLNKQGYNKEEEYFYKLNKELIKKIQKKDKADPDKQPAPDPDK